MEFDINELLKDKSFPLNVDNVQKKDLKKRPGREKNLKPGFTRYTIIVEKELINKIITLSRHDRNNWPGHIYPYINKIFAEHLNKPENIEKLKEYKKNGFWIKK